MADLIRIVLGFILLAFLLLKIFVDIVANTFLLQEKNDRRYNVNV